MNKKEWKIEVIVKNLMEAFVTGLIENLENHKKKAAETIELSNK